MRRTATCVALALALLANPVWAGKPDKGGNGNKGGHGNSGSHGKSGGQGNKGGGNKGGGSSHGSSGPSHGGGGGQGGGDGYAHDGDHGPRFSSSQRSSYADWYHDEYSGGCPPGLAKKHNGCMPPGLAKKRYQIGYPLPPGVVLAPLPPALVVVFGAPPVGYRYGLLDGDVVKLAIGTALVVDAIDGLTSR
jgi:hypothetical protein